MVPFWQTLRPLRKVGKLRKIITVPTFDVACGENKGAILVHQNPDSVTGPPYIWANNGTPTDVSMQFTMECWVKPAIFYSSSAARLVFGKYVGDIGGGITFVHHGFYISSGKFQAKVYKAGYTTISANDNYTPDQWYHLAMTYDGTTLKLYINGVLQTATGTVTAPLDDNASDSVYDFLSDKVAGQYSNLIGSQISYCRVWDYAFTDEEVLYYKGKFLNVTDLPATLLQYFKLSEGSLGTQKEYVSGINFPAGLSSYYIPSDNENNGGTVYNAPLYYGASFIAGVFPILTNGTWFSLKFPITKPEGVNFVFCVSWFNSTTLETKRYQLWHVDGEDLFPGIPDYNGEKLPDGAELEIWNIDGNAFCNLPIELIFETSLLATVSTVTETTQSSAVVSGPTLDETLAAEFPLTPFPLVFDIQQTY